jgi:hypothetical protein
MFKYKTDAGVQAMTEQEANDYAVTKERKAVCKQKLLIQQLKTEA